MKKRGKVLMAVLAVMTVLFASCASHLGEDENAAASKAVKINFAMLVDDEAAQKAVALNGSVDSFKFFYKATPQWKSASAIQGDTGGNYVEINSDMAHMTDPEHRVSIGYFKPGIWKFDVVITSSDGDPDSAKDGTKVIYKAKSTWSDVDRSLFDNSDRTVDLPAVPMELYTTGSKATIILKLAVPKILTGTAPDVTVTISGGDSAAGETTVNASPAVNTKTGAAYDADPVSITEPSNPNNTLNWYYFTKTISNFIPGNYDFLLKYKDAASGNQVGGAIISTTILPTTYTIWGTIENGEYQLSTLTLTVDSLTVDFVTDTDGDSETRETSVAKNGTMVCTPTPLKSAISYMTWYVNGVAQSAGVNGTSGVFEFGTGSTTTTANPGTYEIVCKAQKGDAISYKSYTVTVEP